MFATLNSTTVLPAPPEGAGTGPGQWQMGFEAEVRCPRGGRVALAASLRVTEGPTSGAGSAAYEMRQIHERCRVDDASDVVTVSGHAGFDVTISVVRDGSGDRRWSGVALGDIDWEVGPRSGRCEVDLTVSPAATVGGWPHARLDGTACGHPVAETVRIR